MKQIKRLGLEGPGTEGVQSDRWRREVSVFGQSEGRLSLWKHAHLHGVSTARATAFPPPRHSAATPFDLPWRRMA